MFVGMLLYYFFGMHSSSECKTKNAVLRCHGIFSICHQFGSTWNLFPLNMGPLNCGSISRIRLVRLTVWNGSGGTQEIGPGLLTRTAGGSCMKNPCFFYIMYVSNKTWALVHVVGCKISIDKFCWTLIILPNWFVYVHVWSPSQTKVLVERFELHPG